MLIRTHLTAIVVKPQKPKPLKIIQSVLLKRLKTLKYCWLDCPRHLDFNATIILSDSTPWQVLEVFVIKYLFDALEVEKAYATKHIATVLQGGSYELAKSDKC